MIIKVATNESDWSRIKTLTVEKPNATTVKQLIEYLVDQDPDLQLYKNKSSSSIESSDDKQKSDYNNCGNGSKINTDNGKTSKHIPSNNNISCNNDKEIQVVTPFSKSLSTNNYSNNSDDNSNNKSVKVKNSDKDNNSNSNSKSKYSKTSKNSKSQHTSLTSTTSQTQQQNTYELQRRQRNYSRYRLVNASRRQRLHGDSTIQSLNINNELEKDLLVLLCIRQQTSLYNPDALSNTIPPEKRYDCKSGIPKTSTTLQYNNLLISTTMKWDGKSRRTLEDLIKDKTKIYPTPTNARINSSRSYSS